MTDHTPSFLTPAARFRDVSRGTPKPHQLRGDALVAARLTPETWRLEITSTANATLTKPRRLEDRTALDLAAVMALGRKHGVRFLKAMQCLNIAAPLGQGLWEGVPLRSVLEQAGSFQNARRIYYWGFHNNDPKQIFQSSLTYTQVMETPPGELPPFVAYRLNGEPIPLERGGPVRMIVPWSHGFKSIKWLQRIVLTNEYRANDTYAEANNDPESYLKTAAYVDAGQTRFSASSVVIRGTVMAGISGLHHVEYWLRPDEGLHGTLADDDPAWETAVWKPCTIAPAPADWSTALPPGIAPASVWGFDPSGNVSPWPPRYSVTTWSASLPGLTPGRYELRARAVDGNGLAQPQPRPHQKSGKNAIGVCCFEVVA